MVLFRSVFKQGAPATVSNCLQMLTYMVYFCVVLCCVMCKRSEKGRLFIFVEI